MNSVNRTLYIPLAGKAYVSKRGIILCDPKAEEIWELEGFPLKGKSKSKWLAYYMGMRAAVFDRWVQAQLDADPTAVVMHIGCGLDSRCQRVDHPQRMWFDLDFPEVLTERKRYYREDDHYQMIAGDLADPCWLDQLPGGNVIVILEGVSMYLPPEKLKQALEQIMAHFETVHLLMDCYTTFAAKASQYRNPINDVGVTQVYGTDDPCFFDGFVREHDMTPEDLVASLPGMERIIFQTLYAGRIATKMYRLYEYRK